MEIDRIKTTQINRHNRLKGGLNNSESTTLDTASGQRIMTVNNEASSDATKRNPKPYRVESNQLALGSESPIQVRGEERVLRRIRTL